MSRALTFGKSRIALLTPMFSAWVGLPPTARVASEKTFTSRRANSQPARYRYLRLRVSCVPASLERVTFTLVASARDGLRTRCNPHRDNNSKIQFRVIVKALSRLLFCKTSLWQLVNARVISLLKCTRPKVRT